eukprot:CAMPEP_0202713294 /NCGR_PEP_ID=MMETSP1385-20130828/52479_1 /ASSEMBLY_ACC=CAM_ASM_000861 /TAXON_ID=933848 /ORGANISM="Elphidium margaritaceum" /LENGTH=562 /DNA_ID=CAMNT_0049373591 /DNA_START=53 /DNA_END=1741 /DNA_ORIENTATION=+
MHAKDAATHVGHGLKNYYFKYIKPIEARTHFDKFCAPLMSEADFLCAPMVLLMGQYSVGKTTFIRYLLERDFPGARIGPEPTTDKFVAVMYNDKQERIIPGNAACVQRSLPFKALESFGMSFLNRFEVSEVNAPLLEHISLIDSPGILSGEKQRIARGYDFSAVVAYWATRADRVLLLFDAHKLDISDEFRDAILALRGNFDKIRCVLNKADAVSQQQLMRVYGALLWSLGKVVQTPEVMRVYISSFWDQPYAIKECEALFDLEKQDLLSDLKSLPRSSAVRKVNEFVKRTRRAKVHALICETLRNRFGIFGKEKKQKELLNTMGDIFKHVSTKHNVPTGDFPNSSKFAAIMKNFEMWKIPPLKEQEVQAIEEVLGRGVPKLLEQVEARKAEQKQQAQNPFFGGDSNPFDDVQLGKMEWVVSQSHKSTYDQKFYSLSLTDGKASGGQIKQIMLQSELSNPILGKIWQLSDIDKDGFMNDQEFALCCFLIDFVKSGQALPETLPDEYVPPVYRQQQLQLQQQQQQSPSSLPPQQQQQQQQQGLPPPIPQDATTAAYEDAGGAW